MMTKLFKIFYISILIFFNILVILDFRVNLFKSIFVLIYFNLLFTLPYYFTFINNPQPIKKEIIIKKFNFKKALKLIIPFPFIILFGGLYSIIEVFFMVYIIWLIIKINEEYKE